ncbi:MAG TPA: DUF6252 family protein [Candidatus Kapabacteria bacterium]|nr:DUF6252 family protein [Candidatus Kapabacteria bacterium]
MSRSLFPVFVIVAFLFAACKPDPTSTNSTGTGGNGGGGGGTGNPPAFGYTLNGKSFDRNDHTDSTIAWAIVGHYGWTNTLEIELQYNPPTEPGQFREQWITLNTNSVAPAPATYILDTSGIAASIVSDTLSYKSFSGGSFTITKFDTANNLISGTFHFIAYLAGTIEDRTVQDSVVNGSFTDVPIYEGAYGQGTISANVNGFQMSSKGKSDANSSGNNAAAYTAKEYGVFTIHGVSNDGAAGNRELYLSVASPGIGTFPLAGMIGAYHAATYQWWNGNTGADTEMTAPAGTLTITKFDANTRRMSGTFFFSGIAYPGNDTIHITNGVIDNVQWSVF